MDDLIGAVGLGLLDRTILDEEWTPSFEQKASVPIAPGDLRGRALVHVLGSDLYELGPRVREELAGYLGRSGYLVPRDGVVPPGSLAAIRGSRSETLDPVFRRVASAVGELGRRTLLAVVDGCAALDHPRLQSADILWTATAPDDVRGLAPHGWNDHSKSGDISTGDMTHGTPVLTLATGDGAQAALLVSGDPVATIEEFIGKHHPRVVNMSFKILRTETARYAELIARHPDVLFVKSAGNDGSPLGTPGGFTAGEFLQTLELPNLLVVGAHRLDGSLSEHSNHSPRFVHVVALGEHMVTTPEGTYVDSEGGWTSFSTPKASLLAAKLRTLCPALKPSEVRELMIRSSDPSQPLAEASLSGGALASDEAIYLAGLVRLRSEGVATDVAIERLRMPWALRERLIALAESFGPQSS